MRKYITIIFLGCFAFVEGQVCIGTAGELEWHIWQGLYEGEKSELYSQPTYPRTPDVTKKIFRLSSTSNYDDNYGGRIQGFISVPNTTTAVFNVTGDDEVDFYLSSDSNPDNKVLVAYVPDGVSAEQHSEYPEQTSSSITLLAGEHYYFEIIQVDRWGRDRFAVYWQTDLVSSTEWNVISASFLYGVDCVDEPCPEVGTPCNDGDSNTTDDIEDGSCNCFGTPITNNTCVGERGKITAYRYDGIPGGDLNDLYEAPNFPGMPNTSYCYDLFGRERTSDFDNVGFAMQSFLTVPVSGNYKFNITSDDEGILFISSDDQIENRQAHQVIVSNWTNMTEHDKYIYQSTSNIYLEAGRYYYIEINSKDGGGGEHFSAFWQTPFHEAGQWKRIPAHYFSDYDCELACIAEGTLCDDGNPFTNNDAYDANCDCVGIPCSGPDCDSPLANYIPIEKCAPSSSLDNNRRSSWESCERTANPNDVRGVGHWISYDLGDRHELHGMQVWNFNRAGEAGKGMTAVAVDYSLDGVTWEELGTYNWPLATGSDGYGGFVGPDFQGTYARYVLITSLDAGATCKGLGKVAFTAVRCPLAGTACDDGDELTLGDTYDDNCECVGSAFDVNDCGEMQVLLGDTTLATSKFSAVETVESISDVARDSRVSFVGGKSITLEPGFETTDRSLFIATIDPCDSPEARALIKSRAEEILEKKAQRERDKIEGLTVRNLENDLVEVSYFVEQPGKASVGIYDKSGQLVFELINHEFVNQGLYKKIFRLQKLGKRAFEVRFIKGEEILSKSLLSE